MITRAKKWVANSDFHVIYGEFEDLYELSIYRKAFTLSLDSLVELRDLLVAVIDEEVGGTENGN